MRDRQPVSLQSLDGHGNGLQLQFRWVHDRFSHSLSVILGDRIVPILESIEGTDVDTWPPSPPLQQLSIEELRPSVRVGLLVGMAGKSHWSLSADPIDDRAAFTLDVACRSREATTHLGSKYQLLAGEVALRDECLAQIELPEARVTVKCATGAGTTSSLGGNTSAIWIMPEDHHAPGTTRWQYCVELVSVTALNARDPQ